MENSSEKIKVIVFELQNEEYALPVENVGAIEKMHPITRVPDTPDYVEGVINLRGVIIPIIDLRLRFGMEKGDQTDVRRIIIVHLNDLEVGLIVDGANDVLDIDKSSIESKPEVIDSNHIDYITGVVKVGSRLIILLKLIQILTDEEKEKFGSLEDKTV